MTYFLFIVGFVILIKGADFLVEGSSSIGKRFRISDIVIGLTIVSFGTSLPELLVNLFASFSGSSELALGNIFGSCVANILLILGASALIYPLPITRNTYFSEIPFSLVATLLVGFLANATLFSGDLYTTELLISRYDGVILLFFFSLFLGYVWIVSKQKKTGYEVEVISIIGFTITDIKLCASRNAHNVPIDVVAKMFYEFEPYEGETVVMIRGGESERQFENGKEFIEHLRKEEF